MDQETTTRRDAWVREALGLDPGRYPAAPGGLGAPGEGEPNPFDAPAARVEIERITLPRLQQLAVQQAQNGRADFLTAITTVRRNKKAQIAAEDAKREQMMTLVIAIALMPAGPIIDAAATALAGKALQGQLAEVIMNNAATLQKKFGAKATNKAFDIVAGEAVSGLEARFDPGMAKKALEMGVDKLKGVTIKFAASSDEGQAVESFLDAIEKSADDAMHNLTDVIMTTKRFSEAVAYYNLFSKPLQASYQAVLTQQVENMLSEVNEAMAQGGKPTVIAASEYGTTTGLDEIVVVAFKGRRMLAHVVELRVMGAFLSGKPSYAFRKWITPDMQQAAAAMSRKALTIGDFQGQHVPDPTLEQGERVVQVEVGGKPRLALIRVEDKHGFFSTDYGVRTFVEWAKDEETVRAFHSRGALQNGGIDRVELRLIRGVPSR